jgi:predicted dehydrogenase
VACIQFKNGVVARLTCSIIAPHDHRMRFFGDEGVLWTDDTWFYRSPIYVRKFLKIRRKLVLNPIPKKIPLKGAHLELPEYGGASKMDFARGIADIAEAVQSKQSARLAGHFSLHANELALAIHRARIGQGAGVYQMRSTFEIPAAMPWAE